MPQNLVRVGDALVDPKTFLRESGLPQDLELGASDLRMLVFFREAYDALLTIDAVDELELQARELEARIETLRESEPKGSTSGALYPADRRDWLLEWHRSFGELRAVARRVAELTPLPAEEAHALAAAALEREIGSARWVARCHHGYSPDDERRAFALEAAASILRDAVA